MLLLIIALTVLTGHHPHSDCWCYMYQNRDATTQVFVGQHLFESLVRDKWCVKVFIKRDGRRTIHVCEV